MLCPDGVARRGVLAVVSITSGSNVIPFTIRASSFIGSGTRSSRRRGPHRAFASMILLLLKVRGKRVGPANSAAHRSRTRPRTSRGQAVQSGRTRGRSTDRTVGALTESYKTGIALITDIAHARGSIIRVVVFTHFVCVKCIASTRPGCAAADAPRGAGAADCASLLQGLAFEVSWCV